MDAGGERKQARGAWGMYGLAAPWQVFSRGLAGWRGRLRGEVGKAQRQRAGRVRGGPAHEAGQDHRKARRDFLPVLRADGHQKRAISALRHASAAWTSET